MGLLLLLFLVVPIVELMLLIEVGRRIGTLDTLALIVLTGVLGATLARYQGLQVVRQVQLEMAEGRLPGSALLDGMIILVAAALLVTPGILTDAVGFLCLIPGVREAAKALLWRWLQNRVQRGDVRVTMHFDGSGSGRADGPVYDVTAEELPPEGEERPEDER